MNRLLLLLPAMCSLGLLAACESPTLVAAWEDLRQQYAKPAEEPASEATSVPLEPPPAIEPAASAAAAAPAALPPLTVTTGTARDPGPRHAPVNAGAPLDGLDAKQQAIFRAGRTAFVKVYEVRDGLGPLMNLDTCEGCHSHPSIGGSSGPVNPQVAFARKRGAANAVPSFISLNGPARTARFVRADGKTDGAPRRLFTVAGRSDAPKGCKLPQPDFGSALGTDNVVTRIALPLYGDGLLEHVPEQALLDNLARDAQRKAELGIRGKANTLAANAFGRFGWKAQQKSLLNHAAGAFGGELGLSSPLAAQEPAGADACQAGRRPNLIAPPDKLHRGGQVLAGDIERVTEFIRLLAPPVPSSTLPGGPRSIANGRKLFAVAGCDLCHVAQLRTAASAPLPWRDKVLDLYSDLLLHDMGTGLADQVQQGTASGQDWRTPPLWGLGQRLFLLHDGRTSDLREAVLAHRSPGSEANAVVDRYVGLSDADEQDLLNFLRSL
jgi:CxxC motif-containing protein (DUF1111 family)